MPRKEPTCSDCLNKGYLSILGRRHEDERKIVPCTCRHGRRFLRMWRVELRNLRGLEGPGEEE